MNAPKRSNLICERGFGLQAIISVAATSAIGQLATYPNLAPQARQTSVQSTRRGVRPGLDNALFNDGVVMWRILRLPERGSPRE
jgi:hypothetical protein